MIDVVVVVLVVIVVVVVILIVVVVAIKRVVKCFRSSISNSTFKSTLRKE